MHSVLRLGRLSSKICGRQLYTSAACKCRFQRSVNLIFGKYLLTTNILSSGILMGLGDLMQQEIEYQKNKRSDQCGTERYDKKRLVNMFLIGFAQGPLHHVVYRYLDKLLPGQDLKTVGKKIIFDQLVSSPLFIATFFWGLGLLEKKSLKESNDEMMHKFLLIYAADWVVWPPTQFINFYYLPSQYRVLYINFVTMLYDIFLSYVKHRD